VNIHSSLVAELKDKRYRDGYVASQITFGLPLQIRALRAERDWTQGELADAAGMTQPRIAEIEKPGKRRLNLETLLRIASAYDVGLEVRFVPFGKLVGDSEGFSPDSFRVPSFDDELKEAEREARYLDLVRAAAAEVKAQPKTTGISTRVFPTVVYPQSRRGELVRQLKLNLGDRPGLVVISGKGPSHHGAPLTVNLAFGVSA
jgi:transcriptional regulator with XRE-family HTH domain